MSDKRTGLGEANAGLPIETAAVASPNTEIETAVGKPAERLKVTIEFAEPMDRAALNELVAAIKLYGTVVEATHQVLRRSKRTLV